MNAWSPRRKVITISIALLLVLLIFVCWLWPSWQFKKRYQEIQPGDSEGRVTSLLGEPTRVILEQGKVTASIHTKDDFAEFGHEAVKAFSYEGRTIMGQQYIISFDSDGRAIAKTELVSP